MVEAGHWWGPQGRAAPEPPGKASDSLWACARRQVHSPKAKESVHFLGHGRINRKSVFFAEVFYPTFDSGGKMRPLPVVPDF